MSFLSPLYLAGALAIGLPVLFHLIRRSSKERKKFSSLMFLQESPPRVTSRSRLEHWLLLILRCLVICLLALGFARPFFQQAITTIQEPETTRKIIVLIDTSASMRREGVWPAALARARDALKEAVPGDQVAIYTFDTAPRQFLGFEQWTAMNSAERVSLASARLAELKPGWGGTHLGEALIAASEAFAETDKHAQTLAPRRIVLVSDMQEGARLDGLQGYEWPRGIEVRVEPVTASRKTNAGLQWLQEKGESAVADSTVGTRVRVNNAAGSQREQFQLRWDGVAAALPLDVYVPPGQSRIVTAPVLPTNAIGERLVLSGDEDDFDNIAYVLQPKPEQVSVFYVGNEKAEDSTQPLYYLKRALQPTPRQSVAINVHETSSPLAAEQIGDARLVIVSTPLPGETTALGESFFTNLSAYLNSGGTVLYVAKDLDSLGSAGALAQSRALGGTEFVAPKYAMFGRIDFEHPLFAPFSDPRFNDFTKIHFWKYRKVNSADLPGARVLAESDAGDPLLLEIPRGRGRLLIFTSGWQPADSQLALSSKFVPLLFSMIELSRGAAPQTTQWRVGDQIRLADLGVKTSGQPAVISRPDGRQVSATAAGMFTEADVPGIYTVTSSAPPIRFVVNLDASESRTAPLAVDELQRLGVPSKPREVEMTKLLDTKRRLHDTDLEARQKLWRWLTLAVMVILLVETWLAGRLTRAPRKPIEAAA